jgi:hypothetical protein
VDTSVLSVAVLLSAVTFGLLAAVPEALPVVTFLWQWVAVGAFIGALLAYRRKGRDPASDPFILIMRWSLFGLGFGALLVALAVLS